MSHSETPTMTQSHLTEQQWDIFDNTKPPKVVAVKHLGLNGATQVSSSKALAMRRGNPSE